MLKLGLEHKTYNFYSVFNLIVFYNLNLRNGSFKYVWFEKIPTSIKIVIFFFTHVLRVSYLLLIG